MKKIIILFILMLAGCAEFGERRIAYMEFCRDYPQECQPEESTAGRERPQSILLGTPSRDFPR